MDYHVGMAISDLGGCPSWAQINFDSGKKATEFCDTLAQPKRGKRGLGADDQCAGLGFPQQVFTGIGKCLKAACKLGLQIAPVVAQLDSVAVANEQIRAKPLFKIADVLADYAMADVQLLRGFCKAGVSRGDFESTHRVQMSERVSHEYQRMENLR
jgi:hypothetical protein